MSSDILTLSVNGKDYTGWTTARVSRTLDACASTFDLEVTERWAGQGKAWQIVPGDSATIAVGDDLLITGYVEGYEPSFDAGMHSVRITGRSKTCDLVDCMPDISGGSFNGYTLDKIAAALAKSFGITVSIDDGVDVGDAFPVAMLEKTETAYAFLDKMCRMRGILACDAPDGSLRLTRSGTNRAACALLEGENIQSARASLTADQRFQTYAVLSQTPMSYDNQSAQTVVSAIATDAAVTRPRRFAEIAEIPSDQGGAKTRATWRRNYNYGQSVAAEITVMGWRQTDGGDLWDVNLMTKVKSPLLALDLMLLTGSVGFAIDETGGRTTQLTLKPQAAYTPEPVTQKTKSGTADTWNDAQ